MSVPSVPNWWRMLGWGLLASLALHWMMFDLMRAAAWLPSASTTPVLQVRLEEHGPRIEPVSAAPAVVGTQAIRPIADTSPRAAGSESRRGAASANTIATAPRSESSPAAIRVEGLRSGQPTEAMVALRLAIAQSLGKQVSSAGAMPQSLLLWCDFDGAGHLRDVRGASGSVSPAVQAWVKHAVAQVITPEALVGSAFSLDLLLETGD